MIQWPSGLAFEDFWEIGHKSFGNRNSSVRLRAHLHSLICHAPIATSEICA